MGIASARYVRFARSPRQVSVNSVEKFTPQSEYDATIAGQVTSQHIFEDIQSIVGQINESVQEYEDRRQSMINELQAVSIEMAVAVAAKMVFKEINEGASIAEPMVRQLIESLDNRMECKVWLNPDDMDLIKELILKDAGTEIDHIEFLIDPTLGRGDCRINNGTTEYVSSVHLKLAEIRQHLMESLQDAEAERRRSENSHRGIRRFPDRRATG